jgi:hypothetical protein
VNFSTTVSLIALVVSVLPALASILSARYARYAARAARDQADASRDQVEAAKQQLILEQDRRNDELAEKRREDQAAGLADMHVVIRDHPQEPRIKSKTTDPTRLAR